MSYDAWKDAGDEPQSEYRTRPRKDYRAKDRKRERDVAAQRQRTNENSTQPKDVSDDVWGLTGQWWEQGIAALGSNPIVRRSEFAKALRDRINSDPDAAKILRPKDWDDAHRFIVPVRLSEEELRARKARITEIVAEMISQFWQTLEVRDTSGNTQHKFFEDWDELWYDAVTNLEVRQIVKGLETGETKRVPANYRMVSEESREAHRMRRLQIRLRNQQDGPERQPVTDEDRAAFADWIAERNRARDSVAN